MAETVTHVYEPRDDMLTRRTPDGDYAVPCQHCGAFEKGHPKYAPAPVSPDADPPALGGTEPDKKSEAKAKVEEHKAEVAEDKAAKAEDKPKASPTKAEDKPKSTATQKSTAKSTAKAK